MKKIYLILLTLVAVMFTACDEVPAGERLTYVEPPEVGRAVLIEDYTGQYCVNCPKATEEIERLVEQYGDSVIIAVAIHSGPFSKLKGEPSPLYTPVGDEYFNYWGLSAQPVGIIDKLPYPLDYTAWVDGVNYEITMKPPVTFMMNTMLDAEAQQASIEVQTIGLDSAKVSGKLQVWLVEDSIDSFQYMPDGSIREHYNHMHVFRTCVNETQGEPVSVERGQVVMKNYTVTLDPAWVPEHCAVIAIFFDEEHVRQVARFKLIE